MSRITHNEALSELSVEIFRLTARLNKFGDRLARQVGLSSARWQVLGTIAMAETSLSVAEIARRMGLQRQSVQRTADALESEGFISYESNPRHRRAKLATLTGKGNQTLTDLQKVREDWSDRFKDDLSRQDVQQAAATLIQLRNLLDQIDDN